MWEDIRIGDRVRQKADGPVMIVEAYDGKGAVYCFWTEDGTYQRKVFRPNELELVERPRAHDPTPRNGSV